MDNTSIFIDRLEKEKLIDFAERFDEMKDLKVIVRKYNLENQLEMKEKITKI